MTAHPVEGIEAGSGIGVAARSVSVMIRTKNEARHLDRELVRLKEQVYDGAREVIVVDSGSTDDTRAITERHGSHIITIPPERFSFGGVLNAGVTHASGQYVRVITDAGGFDETFQLCEDWDLTVRISRTHPLHHIPKITSDYNLWSRNLQSIRNDAKLREAWKQAEEVSPRLDDTHTRLVEAQAKASDLEAVIASLREDVRRKTDDLRAVRTSASFSLGRALTWPARKLRAFMHPSGRG